MVANLKRVFAILMLRFFCILPVEFLPKENFEDENYTDSRPEPIMPA